MSDAMIQAVYEAIETNHIDHLRTLLPMAPNATKVLKCGDSRFIQPLLVYAVERGNVEIVKTLLEVKGIDIDIVGMYSDATPLNRAIVEENRAHLQGNAEEAKKYLEIAEILLKAKARPNKKCAHVTPVYRAALDGREEMVNLLIKHGADVNVTSYSHKTPLMMAAQIGRIDCVKLLIKKGAHLNLRDDAGHTALEIARLYDRTACVEYLESEEKRIQTRLAGRTRPTAAKKPSRAKQPALV